jgi:hypothetical protein
MAGTGPGVGASRVMVYLPLGDSWGWVVSASTGPLYPQGRFLLPVTECWVAFWAGLGGCGEDSLLPDRGSDPEPSGL